MAVENVVISSSQTGFVTDIQLAAHLHRQHDSDVSSNELLVLPPGDSV